MRETTTALSSYDTDPEAEAAPLACDVESCPPHHFVIESPSGDAVSPASCRKCGMQREYRNWLEQYDYIGTAWKRSTA